jgi:hypothetical protein
MLNAYTAKQTSWRLIEVNFILLFPQRLAHNVCRYERVYSIISPCLWIDYNKKKVKFKTYYITIVSCILSIFINLCYFDLYMLVCSSTSLSLTKPALSCEIWTKPLSLTPISTKQPKLVYIHDSGISFLTSRLWSILHSVKFKNFGWFSWI